MSQYLLLFLTIVFCSAQSSVQAQSANDSSSVITRDLRGIGSDAECIWNGIVHAESSSLTRAGLIALSIGAVESALILTHTDNDSRNMVQRNQNSTSASTLQYANDYGHTTAAAIIGASTYISGWAFGSEDVRVTGRQIFESLILAGIITTTMKVAVGRARPYTNHGDQAFCNFAFKEDYYSFPSGHATVAFAVSSVLASRINNTFASIGLYGLAGATSYARMYFDKHYLSDVLLGGAIGTLSGIAITHCSNNTSANSTSSLSIIPTPNGIELCYQW